MKILITGATGFIGQEIVRNLLSNSIKIIALSRNTEKGERLFSKYPSGHIKHIDWDPQIEIPPERAFSGVTHVINLMGENIANKRWNNKQKKKIYDSRVTGTRHLVEGIQRYGHSIQALISTSAVGIYRRAFENEVLHEESPVGNHFLNRVCIDWEKEAMKSSKRTVIIRVGAPMGKNGGIFQKILPIFKLGLGGKLSTGQHSWPWIHVEDLAQLYINACKNDFMNGIYNGVGPSPISNMEFTKTLGAILNRPTFLSVPRPLIKLAMGEMGNIAVENQNVISRKIDNTILVYKYKNLGECLSNLCKK